MPPGKRAIFLKQNQQESDDVEVRLEQDLHRYTWDLFDVKPRFNISLNTVSDPDTFAFADYGPKLFWLSKQLKFDGFCIVVVKFQWIYMFRADDLLLQQNVIDASEFWRLNANSSGAEEDKT